MLFYVYLIKTIKGFKNKSYVGFTNNIKNRLAKHNENKGAKTTKGYKWELVYKKGFKNKSSALSYGLLRIFNKNTGWLQKQIICWIY